MKKLLGLLTLFFVFPLSLQAGGSPFQVNSISYFPLYFAGETDKTILEFSIENYQLTNTPEDVAELTVTCYYADVINSVKLQKGPNWDGLPPYEKEFLQEINVDSPVDGEQTFTFYNLEDVLSYGEETSFILSIDVPESVEKDLFSCHVDNMVLYDAESNTEYDVDTQAADFQEQIVEIRNHDVVYVTAEYGIGYQLLEEVPLGEENVLLHSRTFSTNEDNLILDKLFVSCEFTLMTENLLLNLDGEEYEPSKFYTSSYSFGREGYDSLYMFAGLNHEVARETEMGVYADILEEQVFFPAVTPSCWSYAAEFKHSEIEDDEVNYDLADEYVDKDLFRDINQIPLATYEDEILNVYVSNPFPDTDLNTLEGKAAAELYRRSVIGGYSDGEFKGDRQVNRAEAAKFLLLSRYDEIDLDKQNSGNFKDVLDGRWYVPYIMEASDREVIVGYPDGTFRPELGVNTVEFLKMLTIVFDLELDRPYTFTDVNNNAWYSSYVGTAEYYNLFPNRKGELYPASMITRNEMAVAIYQFLKNR